MMHKVVSNLMWMLAERGLQIGAGIGVVAMLARGLGPEGFAHFQYAQAVVYVAASVALLCGAEVVIPRLVAHPEPQAQHRLLMHAFGLRLAAGMLGYLLMCGFLAITQQPMDFWLPALILGIAILLREPFGVVTAWMQAHTRTRPNTLFNVVSLTIKVAGVATLFALGVHSVPAYATMFSAEPIVLAALLAAFYLSRAPRTPTARDPELTRELFTSGLLFWVSFMCMMASRRVDQLLLKPFVSLSELGAYAASMQILDNFVMLATILSAGLAPVYVYSQSALAQARRNVLRIAGGMVAVGAIGGLAIALSAHWIVHLLYGAAFGRAVELLQLTALASTLVFADVALTLLPIHMRVPRLVAIKWALALVATLAVDAFAIPRIGAYGAILGYAVANLLSVLFGIAVWMRYRTIAQRPLGVSA
ncbi:MULTISPECIES: oligosaccharide flippase family protein [Ralstonia]|mgnify:CR=1 FL=1|jgi:PST family polysaccharide transporter|uniref:Membrane protein involved in the export of O-antigen and teichoic acid n=1 Tax=Ralstonia pickettii OR214 TaxID=1264675 RepID=R0CPP5_RALPI|nr:MULTISPECIES: oligosaccharide flippase family protein [Ralstonia]MEA3267551.1 oligosaccharide flippase family protein [Pseudomonadota bacterium]ENZ78430.1 membrane protein involved in the export of O-antigen and teichoic acid [Ralstonia pickettii OR214]MBL4778271.1 oligosaccharide flippase family protein [Ralstonia sp.]MCM3580967.1 oligosaccharide flippase family protein [Ralstonia pickettii]OYU22608.1 MAG: lipopolysaccharide biosynthesis protein [Ralstonia sp. PBBBR1]